MGSPLRVDFRTIARNEASGEYENREATAEEKRAVCVAIYFGALQTSPRKGPLSYISYGRLLAVWKPKALP